MKDDRKAEKMREKDKETCQRWKQKKELKLKDKRKT